MLAIESSLLDISSFSPTQLQDFLTFASQLKKQNRPASHVGKSIALLFFEPSTRTRLSFERAAHRAGLGVLALSGERGSSLEKGETIEDSVLNIAAMKPELIVIRCGNNVDLTGIAKKVSCPVINAGWGVKGHPTQALLDVFTMQESFQSSIKGKKLLIVGDVKHSRVASSHFELAEKLGYEIGICGPKEFLVEQTQIKKFSSLAEGLQWADAVMALRVQFERHEAGSELSKETYRAEFGLSHQSLQALKKNALILHPGPINHGIEMETEVLQDSRCQVLNQVTHGVFMREALLRYMLGEKK